MCKLVYQVQKDFCDGFQVITLTITEYHIWQITFEHLNMELFTNFYRIFFQGIVNVLKKELITCKRTIGCFLITIKCFSIHSLLHSIFLTPTSTKWCQPHNLFLILLIYIQRLQGLNDKVTYQEEFSILIHLWLKFSSQIIQGMFSCGYRLNMDIGQQIYTLKIREIDLVMIAAMNKKNGFQSWHDENWTFIACLLAYTF